VGRNGSTRRSGGSDLCYLAARNVEIPAGKLADLEVRTRDEEKLGDIDGVLIEPSARRVRYLVVKSGRFLKGRYLLPVENLPQLDRSCGALRLDEPAAYVEREAFDAESVRPFTDEDVITVMFAPTAA
jgi:hypothetical protein